MCVFDLYCFLRAKSEKAKSLCFALSFARLSRKNFVPALDKHVIHKNSLRTIHCYPRHDVCGWKKKNSHENAEVEAIVNVHCHISARLCCCRWESGWQSGCHRNDMMGFYVISYLMPFAVDTHSEGMCIKILLSNYFISMLGMECE